MDRRKGKHLDPPAAFRTPRPTDSKGLIPPSHFQSWSAPPLTLPAVVPRDATVLPYWEAAELRRENQRLKEELRKWAMKTDSTDRDGEENETDKPRIRTRSLDKTEPATVCHTLAMSQQAEIISHQLHEIQGLKAELAALQATSAQHEATAVSRENALSHLQGELMELGRRSQTEAAALRTELEEVKGSSKLQNEALKIELEELRRQSSLEADSLREELVAAKERHGHEIELARGALQKALQEAEAERKRQEERTQECLQEMRREHQAELSRLSETHGAEVASLKHQVCMLHQDREAQNKEAFQLEEERGALQNQLSVAETQLASQTALLQQLKTYVGEQELRQSSSEREQLISRVQQLEEEKDTLKSTVELLQVRLTSLGDILALQERELSKKVQLQDPLQPESSRKLQCLLTQWRGKVFALLVQLKSQEFGHMDTMKLLQNKIQELQEEVESGSQKVALLHHSLENKNAEADMEKVRNKALQAEVLRLKELAQNLQQKRDADRHSLQDLADFVSRLHQQLRRQDETWKAALQRFVGLGNRVAFAAKRVDTIQGLMCRKIALAKLQREEKRGPSESEEEGLHPPYEDLQAELQMLHEERDRLAMELKRGAQLIEKKVAEAREKAETDLKEMSETARCLQGALEEKVVTEQALRQQQEATAKQLEATDNDLRRNEAATQSLRQELGQLREEYERALQEKVTEIETQQRRDLSEMEKSLNEARREHTKAVVALRQAERQAARDKARSEELANLQESATQQEKARLEARLQELERDKNLLMATLRQEGLLSQYRQNRLAAVQALTESTGTKPPSKESLFAVLDDLQVLSAAILGEEEEVETEEKTGKSEGSDVAT